MEQKKMVKKTNRKGLSVLAAAVLTASLLGGQIYPVTASAEYGTEVTKGNLIPDNVTISEPIELSQVSLPKSEYGVLSWVDKDFIPSEYIQSCKVIFTPSEEVDLSGISGYDKETGMITGYVNVIVSCFVEEENNNSGENPEEDTDMEMPEATVTPEVEETPEGEVPETTVTPGVTEVPEITVTPGVTEVPEEEGAPEVTVTPEEDGTMEGEVPEVTVTPEGDVTPEGEVPEITVTPGVIEVPGEEETPEATVTPEADSETTETPGEEDNNIFDRPQEPSEEEMDRPSDIEENLSEQEMAEMAEQNHTCNGISVSGINLPWYVQFRATSGESYAFTNEEDAAIFKSYEFELWDLKNNTEYSIPDGQYISVTVPVKEGYDYSVEHLLDNGAMETIIPNVEDGVMVFSTHSFSPFGIAGSKPIVDNGIAEDGYGGNAEPTKTPETTKAPEVTKAPSSDGKNQGDSGKTNTSVQNQTNKTNTDTENENTADENTDASESKKSVNTGDSTVILPFVILVAAAVIVVGVVLYLKKKRK